VLLLTVLVIRLDIMAEERERATVDGIVDSRWVLEGCSMNWSGVRWGSVTATCIAISVHTNHCYLVWSMMRIGRQSRDRIFTDCGPNAPNGRRWRVGHEDLGGCVGVDVRDRAAILDARGTKLEGSLRSGMRRIGYCGLVLRYGTPSQVLYAGRTGVCANCAIVV
jgi:hypothetical protein